MSGDTIQVSIVSHGQGALLAPLLGDLDQHCRGLPLFVTVTLNRPEAMSFIPDRFPFPVEVISNHRPQGFARNHNVAFRFGQETRPCAYFCVLNPDVRLSEDVFSRLLPIFSRATDVGVAAPLIRDQVGNVEDSARCFPRLHTPVLRVLGLRRALEYSIASERFNPDWVAGMFMLFPATVYAALGGFDERYFLYYEDIDLCARLRLHGYRVFLDTGASVTHAARRDSHHKPKYFWFHLRSIIRLFSSPLYWRAVRTPPVSS